MTEAEINQDAPQEESLVKKVNDAEKSIEPTSSNWLWKSQYWLWKLTGTRST